NGAGAFSLFNVFQTGYDVMDQGLHDVNGDGTADLAAAGYLRNNLAAGGAVGLLRGLGGGLYFQPSGALATPGSISGRAVHAADLNHDGKLDILVGDANDQHIRVFAGNGNGTIANETTLLSPQSPTSQSQILTDCDADGTIDVIYGAFDFGVFEALITAWTGNGDLTF